MLATVRRETRALENQRQSLVTQLELERAKLGSVEGQIKALSRVAAEVHTTGAEQEKMPPLGEDRWNLQALQIRFLLLNLEFKRWHGH